MPPLPPVRVGVSVKFKVRFGVGKQPDNWPGEKLRLRLGLGLGLVLGLEEAIFLGGNCPRTIFYFLILPNFNDAARKY